MTKYRIWRHDAETAYAEVEAADEDAALELVQDGDDSVTWIGTRYNADYEVEEVVARQDWAVMSESEKHALGALAVVLFVVLLAVADGIITGMTGGGLVR